MIKTLPRLYSRTSKGQVQTWQITVDGNSYYTSEGIKNGAISVSKPIVCESKNVGKTNETTPQDQALSEAQSKWQKKIDKGYFEKESDIDNIKFFEPMLAKKWEDYKNEIEFPIFCSEKLDGMRNIINKDGMFSREGKPIVSSPHIYNICSKLFEKYPNLVLDGELYNHKYKHNFNEIISLAKKVKPTPEDLIESAKHLEYWVYDGLTNGSGDQSKFGKRAEDIATLIKSLNDDRVKWLYAKKVSCLDELDQLFEQYVSDGYEGQMVRLDMEYQNKRSKYLLKRKDFIDKEYKLLDLMEGKGNRQGIATSALLEIEPGVTFEAGIIGNEEYARDLLKNKKQYIGQMATVCYFNLTPDGKPRFGKLKIIRNYE